MIDRHTRGYDGERTKGRRIGTLWWNFNIAEGDVTVSELFDDMGALERIDALNDVIGLLKKEHEKCALDLGEEWEDMRKEFENKKKVD
jgi:hypothetical protein